MCRLMTGDLGSFNLKFNSGGIYENRFLIDNERDIFGFDTLEFQGNTYFFGQGHFNMEGLKTNKDIIVPINLVDTYNIDNVHPAELLNIVFLNSMIQNGIKVVKEIK